MPDEVIFAEICGTAGSSGACGRDRRRSQAPCSLRPLTARLGPPALALALAAAALRPGPALAEERFPFDPDRPAAGLWVGMLPLGALPTYAVFSIECGTDGAWSVRATAFLLAALDAPARDVQIDGDRVAFTVPGGAGALQLEGSVTDEGQRIRGRAALTPPAGERREAQVELARTIRPQDGIDPVELSGTVRLPVGELAIRLALASTPGGGAVAQIDIPDQGVRTFPLMDVVREGPRVSATLPGPPDALIEGTFDESGATFSGSMKQAGFTMALELRRGAAPDRRRPQHPQPPFPYETREFATTHPAGHVLAGTLAIPPGPGPHPAAVLISGSGQQDRDETIFGHKPFLVIANALARSGIAAARYDDRGVGGSGGAATLAAATTKDFSEDAAAVVAWLRSADGIDPARVGLIGHSEGGVIAPMVAASDERIAFIVLLAGSGVPGRDLLLEQYRLIHQAAGAGEEALREIRRRQEHALDLVIRGADPGEVKDAIRALIEAQIAATGQVLPESLDEAIEAHHRMADIPWMRFFLTYDPRPVLARVRCPVLALNGTLDLQVSCDQNLPDIEKAIRGAGGDVTVLRYEGLNHLFQPATTGLMTEYGSIETTFDEAVLRDIVKWIRSVAGHAAP
jgi:hypothetical protein